MLTLVFLRARGGCTSAYHGGLRWLLDHGIAFAARTWRVGWLHLARLGTEDQQTAAGEVAAQVLPRRSTPAVHAARRWPFMKMAVCRDPDPGVSPRDQRHLMTDDFWRGKAYTLATP
jgi:hypothetical protein